MAAARYVYVEGKAAKLPKDVLLVGNIIYILVHVCICTYHLSYFYIYSHICVQNLVKFFEYFYVHNYFSTYLDMLIKGTLV
jgi:hypothetical protein